MADSQAARLAQRFHELYEELAPSHGYETRTEARKPWSEVPAKNKALMVAVCQRLITDRAIVCQLLTFDNGHDNSPPVRTCRWEEDDCA